MKNKHDAVNEIISNFNWDRVHRTMELLNWTWVYSQTESGVPSIGELFIQARKMLYDVISLAEREKNDCVISTGGFMALAHYDANYKQICNLQLIFNLTSWDVDLNEDDGETF
jgi:hypothetical protein